MKRILFILSISILCLLFLNNCANSTKPNPGEADVTGMFKNYEAAWASHDVEKIASFFTNDCIYEDVASGVVRNGKEELKTFLNNILTAFPDLKIEMKSYFVAGDRNYTIKEDISEKMYGAVGASESLVVRYVVDDPSVASIEPNRFTGPLVMTAFTLLWTGITMTFAFMVFRELVKRIRLARHGQRIRGEIVRCSGSTDSDGDYSLTVRYRFRSPVSGAWIEGSDSQVRNDAKNDPMPAVGKPVQIVYLDDETYMAL